MPMWTRLDFPASLLDRLQHVPVWGPTPTRRLLSWSDHPRPLPPADIKGQGVHAFRAMRQALGMVLTGLF